MVALLALGVLVLGLGLRLNPLLVVATAALTAGTAAGLPLLAVVAAFGKAFNASRFVSVPWIVLPVIGLLERAGLRERAARFAADLRGATPGRLLTAYLLARQLSAAVGLTQLAGQAQTVRPLIAPMAEAAAGDIPDAVRQRIRAHAAAADNIGVFFGEDIFLAVSSILLIRAVLLGLGISVEPLALSVWAIPSAVAAFAIHAFRLWRLDRSLGA